MGKKTYTPRKGIIIIILALILTILVAFLANGLIQKVTEELIKFIIVISISMTGLSLIAFQLNGGQELKNQFLNFGILMIFSALSGIAYLGYPSKLIDFINFGSISSFLFIWGLMSLLAIIIEERFF